MRIKDVDNKGLEIINTIFKQVVISPNRNEWRKAIEFMGNKIYKLECERSMAIINNADVDGIIRNLWAWESARKQLTKRFGKKFICKSTQTK